PHGSITACTLPQFLEEQGQDKKVAKLLAQVVGGHHGFFPSQRELQHLNLQAIGAGAWLTFRQEIFQQLWDFVGLQPSDLPKTCSNAAIVLLAGLTTVSDWIASNKDPETEYAGDQAFSEYQQGLEEKAAAALDSLGWVASPSPSEGNFQTLFGIETPRPLQEQAIAISATPESSSVQQFVLIEALMGEGKTEAAVYLADRWQQYQKTTGFYIGLPTQATSNQMWGRVRSFLQRRYPDININLTLSHSAAMLQDNYINTICRLDQVYDDSDNHYKGVVAQEWHTARKRTLLSPYGVGTIDQALLGVLRSRHQFVRLFGLAGRTVILDEVHAYDLYTSELIERLLEWLALLGSPVIALSATLPQQTRQNLLTAYAEGLGQSLDVGAIRPTNYPRLTQLVGTETKHYTFPAHEDCCRALTIQWVEENRTPNQLSQSPWVTQLMDQLQSGGCVAILCSTVDRAQQIYGVLQSLLATEELGLFHGRFLFADRQKREQDCLKRFGKPSEAVERPYRYVLVATQVIEQSLDLDFDLMISDLAPIDLLLQRSGRLHRHRRKERPTPFQTPQLWLITPAVDQGVPDFGVNSVIYDSYILLRTWLSLRDRSSLQLPDEMDALIEATYDLDQSPDPQFQEYWQVTEGRYRNQSRVAQQTGDDVRIPHANRQLRHCDALTARPQIEDESSVSLATRLGRESVMVVFAYRAEGGYLRLACTKEMISTTANLALSEIQSLLNNATRLSNPAVVRFLRQQTNPANWTSALLRNCRLLELDSQHRAVCGNRQVHLHDELGVVYR
ncbi:CRISPR-associated helicase Cas3', partial (plasmid) [Synechococcus elongatus PCC 11802]